LHIARADEFIAQDGNIARRGDAETHSVAVDLEDGHDDIASD